MTHMMHQARRASFDIMDDPFGSSLILSVDHDSAADLHMPTDLHVSSNATAPLPSGVEEIPIADYHIAEIGFSYDCLDIGNISATCEIAAQEEPAYSTSSAILSLFGTAA
jgi:hypothetical protein